MWHFLCNFPFFVDWCSPVHALCVIKLVDSHHFERYQFTLQPISNSVICTSEHVDQFVYEKIEFERENGAKTMQSTANFDSTVRQRNYTYSSELAWELVQRSQLTWLLHMQPLVNLWPYESGNGVWHFFPILSEESHLDDDWNTNRVSRKNKKDMSL